MRKGKEVLDEIQVSTHRPRVRITSPRGNQKWNGQQVLEWRARDRDDDPLTYAILYNPHGVTLPWQQGRKGWIPVAWGIQGNEYEVNMEKLPGGRGGRFRIVVTDGFHTTFATSRGRLTVEDKPPTVSLVRPDLSPGGDVPEVDGNQFQDYNVIQPLPGIPLPPGPVVFKAHGSDLEDGPLPEGAFMWFLGKQKQGLGKGKKITAYFENGIYLITLIAVDSAGNKAEEQFTITIGQPPVDIN